MNVARLLYPVKVLGPGKRVGLWLAGCPHHCHNCCNPELWEQRLEYELPVQTIFEFIQQIKDTQDVDGITITGGDPFAQATELAELLRMLSSVTEDILVYTGFTLSELHHEQNPAIEDCLKQIAVLIDGRYNEGLNNGALLRGSSNQNIIILKNTVKNRYEDYIATTPLNMMQNFISNDNIMSVGIPRTDFKSRFETALQERGIYCDGK